MPTVLQASPQGTSLPLAPQAKRIPGAGPLKQPLPPDFFGVAPIQPTARAEGLTNLGQSISQFAKSMAAMQERVNTTQAEEQLVKFEREKNDLFFNPETGYFNTNGRDAYDRAVPFNDQVEELQRTHADQIGNIQARNMFVTASDSQITKAKTDVARHASSQFDAWERGTLTSRVTNTLENASLYWNDQDQLAVQLELGRQSVMDIGNLNGVSAETLAEDLQSFNSKFAVNSIEGALNQSASAAQKALADSKELLEGPDITELQRKIDNQFKVEKNQQDSQSAVSAGGSLVSAYGDQPDGRSLIIEQVNEIEDPDLRKKTMRESMYQFDQFTRGRNERRAASFEAAEEFIVTGGSVEQFIAQNPNAWDDLTAGQKNRIVSGTAVATNFAKLSELLLLPTDKLAKVDPALHFQDLSPSDRRRLISAVESAREGTGESQVGRTKAAQTTTTVEQFFGKRSTWNNKDRKNADAFYATLTAEEEFRVQAKGSELSSAEFTTLLGDMSREVSINRAKWFPGTTQLNIADVPSEELGPITTELHRRGLPATADNIIKAFEEGNP